MLLKQVGIHPIVVHGGGPQIGQMLQRLGVKSRFVDGLRVTDRETMEVVEMVLAGAINKQLVAAINAAGGLAVGLTGKDAGLIEAEKLVRTRIEDGVEVVIDLGFVGEPERIAAAVLDDLQANPTSSRSSRRSGSAPSGETYNINADTVAGAVAAAVKAPRFLLLTDVPGVLDEDKRLIPESERRRGAAADRRRHDLRRHDPQGRDLPRRGRWRGRGGGHLDGRVPHAMLLELFTDTRAPAH